MADSHPLLLGCIPGSGGQVPPATGEREVFVRVEPRPTKEVCGVCGDVAPYQGPPLLVFGRGFYPVVDRVLRREEWRLYGSDGEIIVVNPGAEPLATKVRFLFRSDAPARADLYLDGKECSRRDLWANTPSPVEEEIQAVPGSSVIGLRIIGSRPGGIAISDFGVSAMSAPGRPKPSHGEPGPMSPYTELVFRSQPHRIYCFELPLPKEGVSVRDYPLLDIPLFLFDWEVLDAELEIEAAGRKLTLRGAIDKGIWEFNIATYLRRWLEAVGETKWDERITAVKLLIHKNWYASAELTKPSYPCELGLARLYRREPTGAKAEPLSVRIGQSRYDALIRTSQPCWRRMGTLGPEAGGQLRAEVPENLTLTDIYLRSAPKGHARASGPGAVAGARGPELAWEKLSPTHYRATGYARERFVLVLNHNYHDGWHVRAAGATASDHFVANGFANGWLVKPDGAFALDIIFIPERTYRIALIVSGVLLVVTIGAAIRRGL